MSTEHDMLVSRGACHWAGCAIDESPPLFKRGTFVMDDFSKKGRIQPRQIQRVQEVAKAVINVINNLQQRVVFVKDGELHSTEHCQGFAEGEWARS